jgi:hypothetical protein
MKPKDEIYAKDSFVQFLEQYSAVHVEKWREYETPDYFVTINDVDVAVEVTAVMNQLSKEGINKPIASLFASTFDLETKIKREAVNLGLLDGAYILRINKPLEISKKHKNLIRDNAINYIQCSQEYQQCKKHKIFEYAGVYIEIEKIHKNKQYISINGPTLTRWSGEVFEEIISLLNDRISSKSKKLTNITHPKILLLLDRYHFADKKQYIKAIQQISSKVEFSLIFLVQQEYSGIVLYSSGEFDI